MQTLTLDDVRRLAPAAFSNSPDSKLSDSYAHVSTARVLEALQQDGWQIKSAAQGRFRSPHSLEHGRHEIRLWHPELPAHSEGTPLMMYGGSSNGSYAVRQMGGFLRAACLNQCYTGIKVVGGVFHHRGAGLEDRIVANARGLRKNFDLVISRVDLWRQIELSPGAQIAFARRAVEARWPTRGPIEVAWQEVMAPRRREDVADNLWVAFNRAQEAVMRGGWRATFRQYDSEGTPAGEAVRTVRRVTALAASERINTQLWELADAVASGEVTL